MASEIFGSRQEAAGDYNQMGKVPAPPPAPFIFQMGQIVSQILFALEECPEKPASSLSLLLSATVSKFVAN